MKTDTATTIPWRKGSLRLDDTAGSHDQVGGKQLSPRRKLLILLMFGAVSWVLVLVAFSWVISVLF